LRDKRMQLAKEQGVPPYVIFHDATLTIPWHARCFSRYLMQQTPLPEAVDINRFTAASQ